jgi:hypothetical protein
MHHLQAIRHILWIVTRGAFYALPSIVAFCVAAFGVAVIYMDELQDSLKRKRVARWSVAIFFIIMGIFAFVSDLVQRNADKAELGSEREASRKDRELLLNQNGQLIAFAKSEATHDDIRVMTQDSLRGIGNLNSTVRQHPPPTATTEPLPQPTVEHTRFTFRRAPSNDPALPYGLQVIISSDTTIPVGFAILCTGEVGKVNAFIAGHGAYMDTFIGPSPNNKNVAVVKFSFPSLAPESPLVVTILSKTDIRVQEIGKIY